MDAGGSKFGCGFGSSGPKMLGLRLTFALCLTDPFGTPDLCSLLVGVPFEIGREGVRLVGGDCRMGFVGVNGIEVGGGDDALVRAFFAFLRLNFSSSSDVTSESLASLKSMLIAIDSILPLELAPNEGARFKGRLVEKAADPVKVSARLIRRILGSIVGSAY